MKMFGGVEVYMHLFFTKTMFAVDGQLLAPAA